MTKNVNNKKISQINEFFAKNEYIFEYQGLSPPYKEKIWIGE